MAFIFALGSAEAAVEVLRIIRGVNDWQNDAYTYGMYVLQLVPGSEQHGGLGSLSSSRSYQPRAGPFRSDDER